MSLKELIEKLTSGTMPTFELGGGGILLALLALKLAKGVLRILLILVALALLGGAVWWHFRHQ